MASAAPCISRAAKSHGNRVAYAKSSVEAARIAMPATSGRRRPMRSEKVPIGIDTASNVTPKEAKRNPMTAGVAPSRAVRSGSTGTAIE